MFWYLIYFLDKVLSINDILIIIVEPNLILTNGSEWNLKKNVLLGHIILITLIIYYYGLKVVCE